MFWLVEHRTKKRTRVHSVDAENDQHDRLDQARNRLVARIYGPGHFALYNDGIATFEVCRIAGDLTEHCGKYVTFELESAK